MMEEKVECPACGEMHDFVTVDGVTIIGCDKMGKEERWLWGKPVEHVVIEGLSVEHGKAVEEEVKKALEWLREREDRAVIVGEKQGWKSPEEK
jgi:hypothetical protein